MTNEEIMQKAKMGKLLTRMCIPTIVVMLVIVIYNMADIFFIGKTGDLNQVAAVSLAGPFFSVLQGIGTLLGGGGTIAVSIALGKKEIGRIKNITSFCCYALLLIGAVVAVVVNILAYPIAIRLGATENILDFTVTYIRIIAIGSPVILFANVFGNIVRADGSAKESMIGNIAGTIVNVVLDPILILVFQMGVQGAAIATVIGNIASCIYLMFHICRKQKQFSLQLKDFVVKNRILIDVVTLGIPMATSTVLMSFSSIFVNKLLIGYGDVVIAAHGVASKVGMLLGMIAMGICMGVQPAISYCFGAGNIKRMVKIIKSTAILNVVIGSVLTIICVIFRNEIVASFINDEALLVYGRKMVIGGLVTGPICGIYQLCTTFLQATGKVPYATVVSILRQGLMYIPVIMIMNIVFGLNGLIFAGAVSDIASIIIALILSLIWYKKINNKKENENEEDLS